MATSCDKTDKIDNPNEKGRNWCFTFFYADAEDRQNIQNIGDDKCKYIIYGEEKTADGKPHLQGYIELYNSVRRTGIKKLIDPIRGNKSPVHVRCSIAGREFNTRYCSKGEQSKEEYDTLADKGPNYGLNAVIYKQEFKAVREGQGTRNDWVELYDAIQEKPDYAHILEQFPEQAIKYSTGIQKAIKTVKNGHNLEKIKDSIAKLMPNGLYTWQKQLVKELSFTPDDRKITWYVDKIGNCGKTTFGKFLRSKGDCAYFTNAKTADITYAYEGQRTVIFDFTRTVDGHVNYSVIEQLKNGIIFSGKYESKDSIYATPHIICFSNFHPTTTSMSEDRWDIRYLNHNELTFSDKAVETAATPTNTENTNHACTNTNTHDNTQTNTENADHACTNTNTHDNVPTSATSNQIDLITPTIPDSANRMNKPFPLVHSSRNKYNDAGNNRILDYALFNKSNKILKELSTI